MMNKQQANSSVDYCPEMVILTFNRSEGYSFISLIDMETHVFLKRVNMIISEGEGVGG